MSYISLSSLGAEDEFEGDRTMGMSRSNSFTDQFTRAMPFKQRRDSQSTLSTSPSLSILSSPTRRASLTSNAHQYSPTHPSIDCPVTRPVLQSPASTPRQSLYRHDSSRSRCSSRAGSPAPPRRPLTPVLNQRNIVMQQPSLSQDSTIKALGLKRSGSVTHSRRSTTPKTQKTDYALRGPLYHADSSVCQATAASSHLQELFGAFVIPPSFDPFDSNNIVVPKLARSVSNRSDVSAAEASDASVCGLISPIISVPPTPSRKRSLKSLRSTGISPTASRRVSVNMDRSTLVQDLENKLRSYASQIDNTS